MLKERFSIVASLIKDGTIQVMSRDQNGRVELTIPKVYWMQMTATDLWGGVQGRFADTTEREVRSRILSETPDVVNIEVFL